MRIDLGKREFFQPDAAASPHPSVFYPVRRAFSFFPPAAERLWVILRKTRRMGGTHTADRNDTDRSADARRRGKPREKPISDAYPEIDNDLARDNLENDIPAADLEDL